MVRVAFWTAVFLVMLRLAIGWHFFFEGVSKLKSETAGPGQGAKAFTSEGYFQNARGPLGGPVRGLIGDPDERALALLTLQPVPEGKTPEQVSASEQMPPALKSQWDAYFGKFVEEFGLSGDRLIEAEKRYEQAKADVVDWLREGRLSVTKTFPGAPDAELDRPVQDWIAEYRFRRSQIEEFFGRGHRSFGKAVMEEDLRRTQQEANKLRNELLDALEEQSSKMRHTLGDVFNVGLPVPRPKIDLRDNPDPRILELVNLDEAMPEPGPNEAVDPDATPAAVEAAWKAYADAVAAAYNFGSEQKAKIRDRMREAKTYYVRWLIDRDEATGTPLAEEAVTPRRQEYIEKLAALGMAEGNDRDAIEAELRTLREYFLAGIDRHSNRFAGLVDSLVETGQRETTITPGDKNPYLNLMDKGTSWGLTVLGACLLIGLFTRLACTGAALFLLMTYLAVPPFPWLPEPPAQEGTYFFVNKNMIEMLALAALATLPTGRWLGVDGLLVWAWQGVTGRRSRPVAAQPRQWQQQQQQQSQI